MNTNKETYNRKEAFELLKAGEYVYNVNYPDTVYYLNTLKRGGKINIAYRKDALSNWFEDKFWMPKHYWLRGNPNDEFKVY